MGLAHPGLAAPGGRAPVDPAHAVARHERAQVGELDPLAAGARHLVPRKRLRLHRAQQPAQRLAARVDLERPAALERRLVDEQPERVLLTHDDVPGEVAAPVDAVDDVLDRPPFVRLERDQLWVRLLDLETLGEVEQQLDVAGGPVGAHLELRFHRAALDDPLAEQLERRVELRRPLEREAEQEHDRERRRERDQLRPPEHERRDEPDPGQRRVGAELRRRRPFHVTRRLARLARRPARRFARPRPSASAPGRATPSRCPRAAGAAPRAPGAARAGARAPAPPPPSRPRG